MSLNPMMYQLILIIHVKSSKYTVWDTNGLIVTPENNWTPNQKIWFQIKTASREASVQCDLRLTET